MDIEEAENRLFQLKQSMELLDLVTGKTIEEDTKLNIKAIETVLLELEKKDKEIARYKELEEKINILEQEKEYLNTIIDSDNDNYIPKSKVIEKIKELEDGTYDAKIILQQLLED